MQIEGTPWPFAVTPQDLSCTPVSLPEMFPFCLNDFVSEVVLNPVLWTGYDIDLDTYYLRILINTPSTSFPHLGQDLLFKY